MGLLQDSTVFRLAEEMAKAQLRECQPEYENHLVSRPTRFSPVPDSWAAQENNQYADQLDSLSSQFSPTADSWAAQAQKQQAINAPTLTTWGQLARISPDPFTQFLPQPTPWSDQQCSPQTTPDFNFAKHAASSVLFEPSSPTSSNDRSRYYSSSDESLDSVESELRDIVMQGARIPVPPDTYVCHSCYTKGHYIQYCPKALQRADTVALTPYQGPKACIGHFCCTRCHHPWVSRRSFSNTAEICKKCKIEVYPHKQERPFEPVSVLVHFSRSSKPPPPPPGSRPIRGRVF